MNNLILLVWNRLKKFRSWASFVYQTQHINGVRLSEIVFTNTLWQMKEKPLQNFNTFIRANNNVIDDVLLGKGKVLKWLHMSVKAVKVMWLISFTKWPTFIKTKLNFQMNKYYKNVCKDWEMYIKHCLASHARLLWESVESHASKTYYRIVLRSTKHHTLFIFIWWNL